jgi:hypothetical protein
MNLTVEQVQALVEGGLLDQLLNKSPAIVAMHDRLATMETRATEITSGLSQLNEQLKTIAAALQPPPAGAESPADPPVAGAGDGSLARWAPLINALATKALGGGEAPAAPAMGAAFAQVLELFKHFTQFQMAVNEANATAYKVMQRILREEPPIREAAHLASGASP